VRTPFGAAVLLAFIAGLVSPVSAVASPTVVAQAAVAQSTITGHVNDSRGIPLSGAAVSIEGGGQRYATTSASDGSFQQSVPPGVYTVSVSHGGFLTSQNEVATTAGAKFDIDVRLQPTSFESLQVIGRSATRTATSARTTFNSTPASQDVISAQVFQDNASTQLRNELNQTPGIISALPPAVNPASPGAITFPNIRGSLSFETAALIDGHPLAVSDFGDFVTTFLSPAVFSNVEVIKGPGAAAPEIQRAIGGTVNFRTLSPTALPGGDFTTGVDSFGGSYTTLRFTDTLLNGRLGVALVYAAYGTPGPPGSTNYQVFSLPDTFSVYHDSQGNLVKLAPKPTQPTVAGQNNQNANAVVPVLAYGALAPDTYTTHNELVKLRYNLSSATSFTGSYLGEQGWSDQNGNNGDYVPTTFTPGAAYAGPYPTGSTLVYKNPFGYGDEWELDNEPIFQGEFRTSYKNDSILARYYHAAIIRDQSNGGQFASQVSPIWNVQLFGTSSTGAPLNGLDPFGKPYTAQETSGWAFASDEQDKMQGYSFEYDHPFGNGGNVLTFAADTNHTDGHSFNPFASPSSMITEAEATVPAGSTQDVTTYLLRGQLALTERLNATLAYYLTDFRAHYGYGVYPTATSGTPTALAYGDQNFYHDDGRIGLQYRASRDLSLRLAAGSAVSPPYLAILSTPSKPAAICGVPGVGTSPACPSGVSPGSAVVQSITGGNVLPESSFGFDLGGDLRLPNDPTTVITLDLYGENLFNQFVKTSFLNGATAIGGTSYPLYVSTYGNLSRARYEGIEFGLNRAPTVGFGYVAQGALLRGYALGVPPGGYPGKPGIVNYVNFSDESVSNQAIPYSQGYVELNYRTASNAMVLLGATYYGQNNDYDIPATWFVTGSVRFPIHDKHTTFQVSVDNLFNNDNLLFPTNFAGTQVPFQNGQFYATTLKNYGPRQFRFEISHSFSR